MNRQTGLPTVLDETFSLFDKVLGEQQVQLVQPQVQEVGTVSAVGQGIARVQGLSGVGSEELVRFPGNIYGMALNIDMHEVGVILLDRAESLNANAEVYRTGRILDVPVGEALLGRVVDALGRPLDDCGPVRTAQRQPVEREAPAIMDRAPVTVPLQTGLKVVDALIPIGRGQRELILGDRQTGKTAIALDTIINQRNLQKKLQRNVQKNAPENADSGVICIYCAIGQRSAAVAKVIADLRDQQALEYCIVVVAGGEDPPGLQFVAPYAAMTMAEYFMHQGRDTLVVFDDLTHHARAYRELSLLLRRPPGREAYPGDIFYLHSRLLERSTHLRPEHGGGSLTALPIIETEAQNMAAYIPTNLISITDGQIYLSPDLFQKGVLPAVDVGRSVSRVGGKTQLAAYRTVAADLRLSYAQFEELEAFARFGTRLDETTRATLEHGRRVREMLKQPQYSPLSVPDQIALLVALNHGLFDRLPLDTMREAEQRIRHALSDQFADVSERIRQGNSLDANDIERLISLAERNLSP